jgi:hypothetical protein
MAGQHSGRKGRRVTNGLSEKGLAEIGNSELIGTQRDGTGSVSWLLAVQPDPVQADALRAALLGHISAEVVVVDSLDAALSSIDQRLPDVVLLPTLISAAVEDYLLMYLGAIPGAGHVRILGLPHLECRDNSRPQQARSVFPWRRKQEPPDLSLQGCGGATFIRDVAAYLDGARALKRELELDRAHGASKNAERRSKPRFARREVPWVSVVRLGNDQAELIDVSLRGALLQTSARPLHEYLRRTDPNIRRRSRVTFELEWGREVHATGRVIRCVPSRTRDRTHYEIAFSFDDSVGLHLPSSETLVPARITTS